MKINVTEELNAKTLLSHMVIHGLTKAISPAEVGQLARDNTVKGEGVILDVVMTVNGIEIDLQEFVDHWQNQVGTLINSRAKDILRDQFSDVEDLMCDLRSRLELEIEKRLEDWEKPENEK